MDVITVESSVEPVALKREVKPPESIGAWREEQEKDEEKTKRRKLVSITEKERPSPAEGCSNELLFYHVFACRNEFGTILRAQHHLQYFSKDPHYTIEE